MNKLNLLEINGLELSVFLGWPDDERSQKQTVWLDIKMQFPTEPKACLSDELNDTVCYQALIQQLREHIADTPFKLVEHLTHAIYEFIQDLVPEKTTISIALTKHPRQILGLGSVTYHYGAA